MELIQPREITPAETGKSDRSGDQSLAVNIDNFVRTGETVIWRDWRDKPNWLAEWLSGSILVYLVARNFLVGVIDRWGDDDTSMIFVVVIPGVVVLSGLVILAVWSVVRGPIDNPTMVTNRRILQSANNELIIIMLSDVTSVHLMDGVHGLQVAIGRKSSPAPSLLDTRHHEEFAKAVAAAIGQDAPGRIGRLRYLFPLSRFLGFVFAYEAMAVLPRVASDQMENALGLLPNGWIITLAIVSAIFFAWWFLWWLGTHVVAIAAIFVMPLYASPKEAANWLSMETQYLVIPTFGWKSRPYGWLARLVYGSDLRVTAAPSN